MNEVKDLICEVLDRKARYGGPVFLLTVRNVHRAVRKIIPETVEMGGFTGLSRLIIKELERRKAQPWGYGRIHNSRTNRQPLINQIWELRN